MADKYFRFDASRIKSGGVGGRMLSVQLTNDKAKDIHNGFIGFAGSFRKDETEIRDLLIPTTELIKSEVPVIVHKEEINYEEKSRVDYNLGEFVNKAGKPVRAYTLEKLDEATFSEDFFDLTGKSNGKIEVGDCFAIQASDVEGEQLKYSATAPTSANAKCYFKVTAVEDAWIANYVHSDGNRFPKPYKLVTVEVIIL